MAKHEALRGDEHIEATEQSADSTSNPLKRLQSTFEENWSSKLFLPVSSDHKPQRCHSFSPLANSTPVLATQRSMITMSNDSFRSQSVLDDIPTNLLRRYPRFSTATSSIETGRPNFSIEELNSTQLSDDEDDIVNDESKQRSKGSRALLKQRVARDVKGMWRSRTSRIQHAKERLKTWPHKPTHLPVDKGLHTTESIRSHVSRAALDKAKHLPVPIPTLDKVLSPVRSPLNVDSAQSEDTSATATTSWSKKDEVIDGDRSELGKRVATMIREDIQKEHRASSQRPPLRYAASAVQMSSPQVAENHLLLGRQSFLPPLGSILKPQNMATLETIRTSAFGRGRYQSRDSPSIMERSSQPPSRPSTMRGRQSFSSSFNQPRAEALYLDTPDDPGTSFVFPSSQTESRPGEIGGSRPVSHAGSIFSVQTVMSGSVDDACPQVEFGTPLPQGYQKTPAYTIRRIERNEAFGLDSMSLPTLPDSPIGLEMGRETRNREDDAQQPIENGSRASKWSTKVQTTAEELQEQETLVEDPPEERKKDNFAVRGCQKIVRALSNRIASDSLPGRLRSLRWKADRIETTAPAITAGSDTLALSERQVNIRQEHGREKRERL